jgi:hypothetical protein
MADYTRALRQGFEAAKKADLARKEIKEVLGTFKEEVLEASKGKLLIELKMFKEPLSFTEQLKRGSVLDPMERATYLALAAQNPTVEKPSYKELARWKQSNDGYPCSLTLQGRERQFEDRTALEQGLADLLKDSKVGETLYALAQLD